MNVHLANLEEKRNELKSSIQFKEIKHNPQVENSTERIITISPETC